MKVKETPFPKEDGRVGVASIAARVVLQLVDKIFCWVGQTLHGSLETGIVAFWTRIGGRFLTNTRRYLCTLNLPQGASDRRKMG